jgi:hypothetical protein
VQRMRPVAMLHRLASGRNSRTESGQGTNARRSQQYEMLRAANDSGMRTQLANRFGGRHDQAIEFQAQVLKSSFNFFQHYELRSDMGVAVAANL